MSASRSGTLELAVLGLLHETPLHGYELRKRLNSLLGTFRAWGYGSLYPCLKDLLAQGLIAEEPPADADDGQARHPAQARPGAGQAAPRAGPAAFRPPVEDRLPADRGRQGTAAGPAGRGGPGGLGGRRVRRPLCLLRPDPGRHPAAHPGGPPDPAGGAARRRPGGDVTDQGAARQLHARAAPARPGIGRAGGPLAQRAHRLGAGVRHGSATALRAERGERHVSGPPSRLTAETPPAWRRENRSKSSWVRFG